MTINNKKTEWMFENNIGISIKYQGSWSGRDIITFNKTTDGGKTFTKANFIHSNEINEENLFVDGLPYYEDGILKLKVYELKNSKNIYYEFYSNDNGLNWRVLD